MNGNGLHKQHAIERTTAWVGSPTSLVLHTIVFAAFFVFSFLGFLSWDLMFLILTTIVSLEAIYLAIFIQMTVNRQTRELAEVSEDVEDLQENIEEISEGVEGLQEDVEEITEGEEEDQARKHKQLASLDRLTADVQRLLADLEQLKKEKYKMESEGP